MQTFSFETGDDEKYELIEGSHTFQSEVQSIRTEVKTFINCSIRKRKRRVKEWIQLVEEINRTAQVSRAGPSTDLVARDLSRPPL